MAGRMRVRGSVSKAGEAGLPTKGRMGAAGGISDCVPSDSSFCQHASQGASTAHDSRMSLWDALIVAACLEAGVTVLFSEDIPGRAVPGLDFTNPFA